MQQEISGNAPLFETLQKENLKIAFIELVYVKEHF